MLHHKKKEDNKPHSGFPYIPCWSQGILVNSRAFFTAHFPTYLKSYKTQNWDKSTFSSVSLYLVSSPVWEHASPTSPSGMCYAALPPPLTWWQLLRLLSVGGFSPCGPSETQMDWDQRLWFILCPPLNSSVWINGCTGFFHHSPWMKHSWSSHNSLPKKWLLDFQASGLTPSKISM